MDNIPINWAIIGNPINWFIVVLMLMIAGFAAHIALPKVFPSTSAKG